MRATRDDNFFFFQVRISTRQCTKFSFVIFLEILTAEEKLIYQAYSIKKTQKNNYKPIHLVFFFQKKSQAHAQSIRK